MISETTFSRGYSSFWLEYFPWLNSYSLSISKFGCQRINNPIDETDLPDHRAINNTIAFYHFRNQLNNVNANIELAKDESLKYMSRFMRNGVQSYSYTIDDQKIIHQQVNRMSAHFKGNVTVNPFFPGCGIISNCNGDLLVDKKLVEIKAGNRSIIPADIRQLIVYCALNWLSLSDTKLTITEIEIYNPRVGYSWSIPIDEMLVAVSDLPKEDLFEQIGKYLVTESESIEVS